MTRPIDKTDKTVARRALFYQRPEITCTVGTYFKDGVMFYTFPMGRPYNITERQWQISRQELIKLASKGLFA